MAKITILGALTRCCFLLGQFKQLIRGIYLKQFFLLIRKLITSPLAYGLQ